MNQLTIENKILSNLYEALFTSERGSSDLNRLREEEGWDYNIFEKVVHRMTHEGLINAWAAGYTFKITSVGIIHAEEQKIAPEELMQKNQRIRTHVSDFLTKVYDEKGAFGNAHYTQLLENTDFEIEILIHNLNTLENLGYIEEVESGSCRITYQGIEAVNNWRKQSAIVEEFERITKMKPQPRGQALQKLFAKIVEQQGWFQEEGVRTSNEEMDVIVYREREYYLVECKWEKAPIEAKVVRELHGKLSNRVDVRGVITSMSGFAEGAVKQVEDYTSSRVILLFGSNDIHSMIYRHVMFDSLLNNKYKELITRRKVIFN